MSQMLTSRRSAAARNTPAATLPSPEDLDGRYAAIRDATEDLCEPLLVEDYGVQSLPEASPVKWHLAHTSWFFETFLLERINPEYRPFDPRYHVLFNSYYNSVGTPFPRPQRGLLSRPSVEEVYRYRHHVDAAVRVLLNRGLTGDAPAVLELGLHHEQQHQELILTDLKHLFSCNPLRPTYRVQPPSAGVESSPLRWIGFPGGLREVGYESGGFAFDNEMPRHCVYVEAFELAARLVSNAEFLAFVEDGGYERPDLWLSDGWDIVRSQGWRAPLYWERHDRSWRVFSLAGMRPLEDAEPVCHVSYYEADAFARWAGARLPRESEWEVAAAALPITGNFLDSGRFHPASAPARGDHNTPSQMFGDVWEWTESAYVPYPGYRAPAGAFGEYNAKFMSGQMVLRGGSCASPCSHLRATYRNFFPPAARWQFMGVRLARDVMP